MESQRTLFFSYGFKRGRGDETTEFLSNFFYSPFVKENVEYLTVEHFFQAEKFEDPTVRRKIINAESPSKAKKLGRKYEIDVERWNNRRDQVMMMGLQLKFSQNEELKRKLLATGNCRIVEDSPNDKYWGGAASGSLNTLGNMLMSLRETFKKPL